MIRKAHTASLRTQRPRQLNKHIVTSSKRILSPCKSDYNHWRFTITPAGVDDFYGFAVDGNSKFLLADFTVTHNSTALMILSGKLKPNLGRFDSPPDWSEILLHFRGSELQNFFTKLLEDNIKAIIKPQYVDSLAKSVKGKVRDIIERKDERGKPKIR